MSQYYFEKLKSSLSSPAATQEALQELIQETQTFLGILRIRFESSDPAVREQAASEVRTLKQLLEKRISTLS